MTSSFGSAGFLTLRSTAASTKRRILLLLVLASICAVGYAVRIRLVLPVVPQDEGVLLAYADLIVRGWMPARDFAASYPPGTFYLLASVFRVIGETLLNERALGVMYIWFIVVNAFVLVGRQGWVVASIAALTPLIALRDFPVIAHPVLIGAIMIFVSLIASHRAITVGNNRTAGGWALVAGLTVGLTSLFRQDFAVAAGLASLVTMAAGRHRCIPGFLLGTMLGFLPLIAFAEIAGFNAVWDTLVLDPLRIAPGRRFPLTITLPLIVLLSGVAIIVGATVVQAFRSLRASRFAELAGMTSLALLMLPSLLQRLDSWHIAYVGAVIGPLAIYAAATLRLHNDTPWLALFAATSSAASGHSFWRRLIVRTIDSHLFSVAVMVELCFIAVVLNGVSNRVQRAPSLFPATRWVPVTTSDSNDIEFLLQTLKALNRRGARIFVGLHDLRRTIYNDTYLYFLLPDYIPATRYLELNPGAANRTGSGLAQQVESADILMLTSKYDQWVEPNESAIPGDASANAVIAQHFCRHASGGTYEVWLKCR